jgi:nucleoside-diphosphate-sugar epimerase
MAVVAVTGASGFLGGHLMSMLAARGHEVIGIARRGGAAVLRPIDAIDGRTDWSTALRGVEVVVHCAARAHIKQERAADAVAAYREVNVDGVRRLAQQAAMFGVRRLVLLSSVKAVGERSPLGRPLSVSDDPRPEDAYGASKRDAEIVLAGVAASTGLETVVVRPPLVYGPGVKGNFLRLLTLVSCRIPMPLGAIRNARSLVSVSNLSDLLCMCAESPPAAGRTFFASDGEDLSTTALIRRIGELMARPALVLPVPEAMVRGIGRLVGRSSEVERLIGTLQVDISPNRTLLGWVPPLTLDVGLRETVEWFGRREWSGFSM